MALRGYDEDKKERNRKSRAAFADFRSRVEKTCKILGGIADWDQRLELCTELVKDLPNLLNNAGDLITKATMNELTNMLEFAKVYNKSPTTACLKLITHIDQAIDHMDAAYALLSQAGGPQPVHEPSSISMKIIVIAAAVAAVGAGAYFGLSPSEPPPPPPPPNNPPEIGPLGSITEQATSESGAIVTFEVSAYDDEDGQIAVYCQPESGSMFSIGETQVICSANDSEGGRDQESFIVSVTSDNKPKIDVPSPITKQATSESGAIVKFSVSADDFEDGQIAVYCQPESGSMFPVGKTKVTCSTSDSDGNAAKGSFIVNIVSDNKPRLEIPKSITREATSSSGAIVTFEVSAYDDEDGQVQVHCTRESGSTFQIGTTVVDCKATDSNENRVEGSFFVSVRDTTPPTIREFVPTEGAKDASGAVVFFSVTAYDVVDGEVKVSCDYASGTKFPIGTTTVMCFAKDSRGNETTRKLGITVKISNGPS